MPHEMVPVRLWRVLTPDDTLWIETSNEKEARAEMRPGRVLQQLWQCPHSEWRGAE